MERTQLFDLINELKLYGAQCISFSVARSPSRNATTRLPRIAFELDVHVSVPGGARTPIGRCSLDSERSEPPFLRIAAHGVEGEIHP
jgi:hypothetical protein